MVTPESGISAGPGPVRVNQDNDVEDAVLVRRILAGEVRAARALYDRHVQRVHAVAYRVVRDDHVAEDVTQEAFLRAFRGLGTYRGGAPLRAWLSAIAVSAALDTLRKTRPARRTEVPLEDAGDVGDATAAADPILRQLIQRALDDLPEAQRVVLTLFALEGYSHADIAASLGIPVATSKTRLFHARAALREALGPHAPESRT